MPMILIMRCVILAAGEGVRMRPLTLDNPKPLLKIAGKTFIDHIFENFPDEVTEVVLVVKYLADKIKAHCGTNFHGRKIHYAEGSDQGNAYSFLSARPFFEVDERMMIIYGDELPTKKEFAACLADEYSWLCYQVPVPQKSGIATIDESGRILEVIEKPENPKSDWAATGLMVANASVFNYPPLQHKNGEYYLTSMMDQFCHDQVVTVVRGAPGRPQLTTPEDLALWERLYLEGKV